MDVFTLGSSSLPPPRRPQLPSTFGTDFLEGWVSDRERGAFAFDTRNPGVRCMPPFGCCLGRPGERAYPWKVVDLPRRRNISRSRGLQGGRKGGAAPLEHPLRVRSRGSPFVQSLMGHLSDPSTFLVEDVLGPSAPPGWIPSLPFRTRRVPLSNWVETGAIPGQSRSCRGVENGRDQGFQAKQSTPQITSSSRHTCLVQQSRTKRRWRPSCGHAWAWERADWSKEACRPGKKEGTRRCAEATHGKGVPWN